ncbi:MAG: hypothetical protein ABW186_05910 [Rhodanobacteraceae bacterium]
MHATILAMSTLLAALLDPGIAVHDGDHPPGTRCRQEFRAVDDQADVDMRDVNQLITLLEDEAGDDAIASGGQDSKDHLRARLAAAKTRRSDILDKQHDDLNVIRARCDRLRHEPRESDEVARSTS